MKWLTVPILFCMVVVLVQSQNGDGGLTPLVEAVSAVNRVDVVSVSSENTVYMEVCAVKTLATAQSLYTLAVNELGPIDDFSVIIDDAGNAVDYYYRLGEWNITEITSGDAGCPGGNNSGTGWVFWMLVVGGIAVSLGGIQQVRQQRREKSA